MGIGNAPPTPPIIIPPPPGRGPPMTMGGEPMPAMDDPSDEAPGEGACAKGDSWPDTPAPGNANGEDEEEGPERSELRGPPAGAGGAAARDAGWDDEMLMPPS